MNYIYFTSSPKRGLFLFFLLLNTFFSLFAQLPSGFVDSKMQNGYNMPMGLVFSNDGQKMFVWEKAGKIWCSTWNGSSYVKQSSPTLDISDEVANWRDFGMESVALDPNFDSNGLIYMFYQVDRHHLLYAGTPQYNATTDDYFTASISRLTRYKVNFNGSTATADKNTRKILLGETKSTGVPMTFDSHAGGEIVFGTDGTLLVSTGDNASFVGSDMGSSSETNFQQAIDDGIMRSTENVGAFRSQLINSFCGKLLRMDPNTGDGISSNPYFDATTPRTAKSRVWALGFRNPFRLTLKPGTGSGNRNDGNPGTIIVGDVQNGTWEEIHIIEKGGVNCGWPLYEGITPQYQFYDSGKTNPEEAGNPTFLSLCVRGGRANINNSDASRRRYSHAAPVIDWSHNEDLTRYVDYTTGNTEAAIKLGTGAALTTGSSFKGSCAIGGPVYEGTAFPSEYRNLYFFADYSNNWIKAAVLRNNSDHKIEKIIDFAPSDYTKGIVDLVYCPRDESLFYININTGDVQRISYSGSSNRPPVAVIGANRTSGTSPLSVNFSSSGSNDPDGGSISYEWDFDDGSTSTSANPSHTFTSTGAQGFTVRLTVTDNNGATDSKTIVISTNNTAPSVKITSPTSSFKYSMTGVSQLNLKASVTDNDASGMKYAWQVTLRHNTHEHREPFIYETSPTVSIMPVGCDGDTYYYLIELTVTDNGGLVATDAIQIYPDCNTVNPPTQLGCLKASYYNNQDLSGTPVRVRDESSINYDWGYTSSLTGIAADNFSIRWDGTVIPPTTGEYNFTVRGDDGVRLWVNNTLLIDEWYDQSATSHTRSIYLTKGQNIPIKLEYYEGDGRASVSLQWEIPNQSNQIIAFNACAVTSPPSSTFDPNTCYKITARNSGKAIEVPNSSTVNGTQLQQNSYTGAAKQMWKIKDLGDGSYRIVNGRSGKSVDLKGLSTSDGAPINQYDWNSGNNQRWFLSKNTEGYYQIKSKHSGKVVGIKDGSSDDGTVLWQTSITNFESQQFKFQNVDCPTGVVALESANILSATGYRDSKQAVITWVSNANDRTDYFQIQKLNANEPVFEKLETVNAKQGVAGEKQVYSVVDNAPIHGDNFYRVALFRVGEELPQYSEVISLDFSYLHDYMLFPNPAEDYVDIDLEAARYRSVDIFLMDATGKILRQKKVESAPVGPVRLALDDLPVGEYFIRIETEGKREVVKKLMIVR